MIDCQEILFDFQLVAKFLYEVWDKLEFSIAYSIIRQVCGQTLARVRVRTDINSSIIISLQQRKSTWPGSHVRWCYKPRVV